MYTVLLAMAPIVARFTENGPTYGLRVPWTSIHISIASRRCQLLTSDFHTVGKDNAWPIHNDFKHNFISQLTR